VIGKNKDQEVGGNCTEKTHGDEEKTVLGTMKEHYRGSDHWEWTWGTMNEAFFGEKGELNAGILLEIRILNRQK